MFIPSLWSAAMAAHVKLAAHALADSWQILVRQSATSPDRFDPGLAKFRGTVENWSIATELA
jgi:hypothetical protein